jgi:hypothetical protein
VILEKIPELRRLSAEERLMLLTELWDELTALRCPNPRAGGLAGPAVAGLPERPLAKHPWEVVTARGSAPARRDRSHLLYNESELEIEEHYTEPRVGCNRR